MLDCCVDFLLFASPAHDCRAPPQHTIAGQASRSKNGIRARATSRCHVGTPLSGGAASVRHTQQQLRRHAPAGQCGKSTWPLQCKPLYSTTASRIKRRAPNDARTRYAHPRRSRPQLPSTLSRPKWQIQGRPHPLPHTLHADLSPPQAIDKSRPGYHRTASGLWLDPTFR